LGVRIGGKSGRFAFTNVYGGDPCSRCLNEIEKKSKIKSEKPATNSSSSTFKNISNVEENTLFSSAEFDKRISNTRDIDDQKSPTIAEDDSILTKSKYSEVEEQESSRMDNLRLETKSIQTNLDDDSQEFYTSQTKSTSEDNLKQNGKSSQNLESATQINKKVTPEPKSQEYIGNGEKSDFTGHDKSKNSDEYFEKPAFKNNDKDNIKEFKLTKNERDLTDCDLHPKRDKTEAETEQVETDQTNIIENVSNLNDLKREDADEKDFDKIIDHVTTFNEKILENNEDASDKDSLKTFGDNENSLNSTENEIDSNLISNIQKSNNQLSSIEDGNENSIRPNDSNENKTKSVSFLEKINEKE
jgi:hypothetical protein